MQRQAKNLLELRQWLQDIHDHGLQANGVLLISDDVFRSFVKSFDAMLGTQGYELSPDSALSGSNQDETSNHSKLQKMNSAVQKFNRTHRVGPIKYDIKDDDLSDLIPQSDDDETSSDEVNFEKELKKQEAYLKNKHQASKTLADPKEEDKVDKADESESSDNDETPLNNSALLNGSAVDEAKKQLNNSPKSDSVDDDDVLGGELPIGDINPESNSEKPRTLNQNSQTLEDALPTSHEKELAPGWERGDSQSEADSGFSQASQSSDDEFDQGENITEDRPVASHMFAGLDDGDAELPDDNFDAGEVASKTVTHSVGSSVNELLDSKAQRSQAAMNRQIQTSVSTDSGMNDHSQEDQTEAEDRGQDLPPVGDEPVNNSVPESQSPSSNRFGDMPVDNDEDDDDDDDEAEATDDDLTTGGLSNLMGKDDNE